MDIFPEQTHRWPSGKTFNISNHRKAKQNRARGYGLPIRKTAVQENQKTEGLVFYAMMRLDGDADAETQQTHPTQPRELADTWDCRTQGQRL